MRTIRSLILVFLLASLVAALFFGQRVLYAAEPAGDATLSGWVKNESGGAMAGVFVKVTNRSSTMTVSVLSQKDGTFQVKGLQSGKHDVAVQQMGY